MAWWLLSVVSAQEKLEKEDCHEVKDSLGGVSLTPLFCPPLPTPPPLLSLPLPSAEYSSAHL